MKFKTVKAGGAMVVGVTVAVVMVVHPVTLLAKCTCVLVGSALGAVAAEPLQEKIESLTVKIAELHAAVETFAARMEQVSAPAG